MQTALLSLCCGFTGRQLRWGQVRTSERMDVLLKSTDDKVCKVTPRQGLSVVCTQPAATLLSTGSRRHGRPQGIRLGFPPFSLVSAAQGIYQHLNQMQLAFVTRSCKLGRKRWFVGELDFPGLIFVLMKRSMWKGVTCAHAGTSCVGAELCKQYLKV